MEETIGNYDDTSSVDTQDAFLDMLGFSPENGIPSLHALDDAAVEEEQLQQSRQSTKFRHALVSVPSRCSRYLHPPTSCLAFTIDNFYSKQECQQVIRRAATATDQGFQYITEAAHISPDGSSYSVKLQNPNPHKLSVFDHPPSISKMWKKLEPLIFPLIQDYIKRENCGPPLGLNPRLRVLRYDSSDNDRFEPHFDATTMVGANKKSLLTVLLYLNDGGGKDFEGGETLYLDSHISSTVTSTSSLVVENSNNGDSRIKIIPETGKVVIFEHDLFHSGAPLLSGTKYVLRTDVLFAVKEDHTPCLASESSDETNETVGDTLLVSDLCRHLELPNNILNKLDAMDMLEITLESFLSINMLKAMLMDEIGDILLVDEIVRTGNKLVNNNVVE